MIGRTIWFWLLSALCLVLLPESVFAQSNDIVPNTSLTCSGGSAGGGSFFSNRTGSLDDCWVSSGTFDLFGPLLCTFETTLGNIIANIFCAVAEAWKLPLFAMFSLAMLITGVSVLTGLMPMTIKEATIFVFKLGLVATFATQLPLVLEIAYAFFMNLTQGVTDIMLDKMGGGSDPKAKMQQDVQQTLNRLSQVRNNCNTWLTVAMLLVFAPFLFSLFVSATIAYLMFVARAMYGFLFALTMITFLIAMIPIYVSFALFKSTQDMFEKWIEYTAMHCLQIFIVFVFMLFGNQVNFNGMIDELISIMTPTPLFSLKLGPITIFSLEYCTFCEPNLVTGADGILRISGCATPGPIGGGFDLIKNGPFVQYLAVKGGSLYLLTSVMESFQLIVPDLARALSGSLNTYTLGGISRAGEQMPTGFIAVTQAFETGAKKGWQQSGANKRTLGGRFVSRFFVPTRVLNTFKGGVQGALYGDTKYKTKSEARQAYRTERRTKAMISKQRDAAVARYKRAEGLYRRAAKLEQEGKGNKALTAEAKLKMNMARKDVAQMHRVEKDMNRRFKDPAIHRKEGEGFWTRMFDDKSEDAVTEDKDFLEGKRKQAKQYADTEMEKQDKKFWVKDRKKTGKDELMKEGMALVKENEKESAKLSMFKGAKDWKQIINKDFDSDQ